MAQATKLQKAKVNLLLDHPFFGSLLMRHKTIATERIPTAAVNKQGELMVNPRFIENLDVQELTFLLAHEVMHVVLGHLPRLNGRDPEVWNIACDAVINEMLVKERVGKFPHGGVRMQGAELRTADSIYNELMQNADGDPRSGGDGQGQGQGQDQSDGVTGTVAVQDLLPEEAAGATEADARQAETQGKLEIAQAAQAVRMQGKMSGGLAGMIDQIINSKLPWWEILERFMVGKSEQRQRWERPNKRYAGRFYLPRRERVPSMGGIVVGIDTSGSISDREMGEFIGHLNAIIDQCHPAFVHVLYVTTEVEHDEYFEPQDYPLKSQKNRWCGGTDMRAIHQWMDDNDVEPDVCVVFSDMYTPFPDEVHVETLWVSTTDRSAPASLGETLFAEE